MTKYEAVLKAVREACPELVVQASGDCGHLVNGKLYQYHTPRLSHVLRAIADEVDSTACMYPDGTFVEWDSSGDNYYILFRYDLTKDDLSLQSTDTIDFLFNILCE